MLSPFLTERYSEELYAISEAESAAVMAESFDGYDEWSAQLEDEREAWRGSKLVGGVLIKKACEHSSCPHTRCERGLRIGGFEL